MIEDIEKKSDEDGNMSDSQAVLESEEGHIGGGRNAINDGIFVGAFSP